MPYCSLQHWTLLPSPVPSTTGCCFCFGSTLSFFLELFLHWSSVAYWAPTDPGSSSFSVLSFCLFILFMGLSRQEYWSGLPFPSPMDHMSMYGKNHYNIVKVISLQLIIKKRVTGNQDATCCLYLYLLLIYPKSLFGFFCKP